MPVVVVGSLALAGCGGGSNKAAPSAVTRTMVVTKTVQAPRATSATTPDSAPSTDADAGATVDPSDDEVGSGESSGPPVLQATGADRTLTLSDAFSADNWEEGSYTPAGKADPVQGIRTDVYCSASEPIELRFGQTTGTLHVAFAQDIQSDSSDQTLEFDLTVDGRTVKSKNVTFKQSGEMSTPLSGVASIEITAQPAGDNDCESTMALITKLWITAK
ncbi:hypothetical protein [Flexivirga oryzae]|uniref:Glycosyl hydrolase family 98 putative carbohydrate-binding module domain-containing protein n=1 Tax=Flexivirga oryzae TaxID=1794944 RepID=A0A839N908_9MICO|nr:hypothetical protein [Flexivirga oryzae]MBB2893697.1 hypothetical protein [Flexivirga oryzae]